MLAKNKTISYSTVYCSLLQYTCVLLVVYLYKSGNIFNDPVIDTTLTLMSHRFIIQQVFTQVPRSKRTKQSLTAKISRESICTRSVSSLYSTPYTFTDN